MLAHIVMSRRMYDRDSKRLLEAWFASWTDGRWDEWLMGIDYTHL